MNSMQFVVKGQYMDILYSFSTFKLNCPNRIIVLLNSIPDSKKSWKNMFSIFYFYTK